VKVLHVTEAPYEGLATVLRFLLPALERQGLEVSIAWDPRRQLPGEDLSWADEFEVLNVRLRGVSARSLRALRAQARNTDVVHLHGARAGALGRLVLDSSRPIVYSPHGGSFHRFRSQRARMLANIVERSAARRTNAIVVASQCEATLVRECIRDSSCRRVQIIRHGLPEHDQLAPVHAASMVVGVVGRLVPEKGVGLAIEAFAAAARTTPLRLRIYGEGPERADLERRAVSIDPDGRIEFVGFRPIEDGIFSELDILLCASAGESFGLNLAEALVAGCSVVSTTSGVAPEVLHPPYGFLADADPGSLADAIRRAAASRQADPRIALRAIAQARASFSTWDVVACQYAKVYAQVGGWPPPAA
jgi:glycosyltransferase involved in cell wall biosynthesis